jgi:hypothetical protein
MFNTLQRHRSLSQSRIFVRQNHDAGRLTVAEIQELAGLQQVCNLVTVEDGVMYYLVLTKVVNVVVKIVTDCHLASG